MVLRAHYTGEPATGAARVTVPAAVPVAAAWSRRHGDLRLTRPDAEHVELTAPGGRTRRQDLPGDRGV